MKKTPVQISLQDFPAELHAFLANTAVYDTSCHSGMNVFYSERGCYVKVGAKGSLTREADIARLFHRQQMGVEVLAYVSQGMDYLVTQAAEGEDCTHALSHPEQLCEALAQAMTFLHARPIADVPVSPCMAAYAGLLKPDTLIHGDFCLPNIILKDGRFHTFIDVGQAGAGDRHIDLYWVLWSLQYNLKTDRYTDCFLNLYGKGNYDPAILKMVVQTEARA